MSQHAARVVLYPDGRIEFPGIGYEGCKPTLHTRIGDVVVVHISGGGYWSGVGQPRAYAPARFEVIKLKGKGKKTRYMSSDCEEFAYEYIVDFEIKKAKPSAGR